MIKTLFADCDDCTLQDNVFVPSEINKRAKVVFLGEAPGGTEAKMGFPFVGSAGKELASIFMELGKARKDFSFINAACCRPVKVVDGKEVNGTPTYDELKCCNNRLIYELGQAKPKAIVVLGLKPLYALTNTEYKMADMDGKWLTLLEYPTIVTYHPASLLYGNKQVRTNIKSAIKAAIDYR
jgi:DNA polymerase